MPTTFADFKPKLLMLFYLTHDCKGAGELTAISGGKGLFPAHLVQMKFRSYFFFSQPAQGRLLWVCPPPRHDNGRYYLGVVPPVTTQEAPGPGGRAGGSPPPVPSSSPGGVGTARGGVGGRQECRAALGSCVCVCWASALSP